MPKKVTANDRLVIVRCNLFTYIRLFQSSRMEPAFNYCHRCLLLVVILEKQLMSLPKGLSFSLDDVSEVRSYGGLRGLLDWVCGRCILLSLLLLLFWPSDFGASGSVLSLIPNSSRYEGGASAAKVMVKWAKLFCPSFGFSQATTT